VGIIGQREDIFGFQCQPNQFCSPRQGCLPCDLWCESWSRKLLNRLSSGV